MKDRLGTPSGRLQILRGDITLEKTDAIVNAANVALLGGGGVDGAIHRAAGPGLLAECRTLGGCETGMAKITLGYNLSAKYVLHTPGPIWKGGGYGEKALLESCYKSCLELARQYNFETLSFPSISTGAYRYPVTAAAETALKTIIEFLKYHESPHIVRIVCFDDRTRLIYEETFLRFT